MKKIVIILSLISSFIFANGAPNGFERPIQEGRVLISPTATLEVSSYNVAYNTFIISSDFEYQTSYLNTHLAIFGNLGLGFWGDNIMFNIEGGVKAKLGYLLKNLDPFLTTSISIDPLIIGDRITTIFSIMAGGGVQYFITDSFGLEGSLDLKFNRLNNFLPTNEAYKDVNKINNSLSLRFNFSLVFVF